MAHIGETIRRRRKKLGWSIQKLATLTGIDSSFLSRLERGLAGYSPETEEKLARTLNTTVSALHAGPSNVTEAPLRYRRVPLIDYVQAGQFTAVSGNAGDEAHQEYVMVDLKFSPRAFAMRIKGDSMEPEFRASDIVIIDPEVNPLPGDYVVATNGEGEALFKRYRQASVGVGGQPIFELVPLNPDYPTWRSDISPLKIIGVMMEHRRPRRR